MSSLGELLDLKRTLQSYLEVNGWDTGSDKDFKKMDLQDFESYVDETLRDFEDEQFDEGKIPKTNRSVLSKRYKSKSNDKLKLFVFFIPEKWNESNQAKMFLAMCVKKDCFRGLIIAPESQKLTPAGESIIEKSNSKNASTDKNVYILTYYTDDSFIDLTELAWGTKVVKKYSAGPEVQSFCKENNLIKPSSLPQILSTDPVSKFYSFRPGDIVCMDRETGVEGTLIDRKFSYRYVVDLGKKKKK